MIEVMRIVVTNDGSNDDNNDDEDDNDDDGDDVNDDELDSNEEEVDDDDIDDINDVDGDEGSLIRPNDVNVSLTIATMFVVSLECRNLAFFDGLSSSSTIVSPPLSRFFGVFTFASSFFLG